MKYREQRSPKAHAEPGNQRQLLEDFELFALIPEVFHFRVGRGRT